MGIVFLYPVTFQGEESDQSCSKFPFVLGFPSSWCGGQWHHVLFKNWWWWSKLCIQQKTNPKETAIWNTMIQGSKKIGTLKLSNCSSLLGEKGWGKFLEKSVISFQQQYPTDCCQSGVITPCSTNWFLANLFVINTSRTCIKKVGCVPLVFLSGVGRGSWKATSCLQGESLFGLLCSSGDGRNVAVAGRLAITFLCLAVMECAKTYKFLEGAWRDPATVSAGTLHWELLPGGMFLRTVCKK